MAWNPEANEVFLKALEAPSRNERGAYLDQWCAELLKKESGVKESQKK